MSNDVTLSTAEDGDDVMSIASGIPVTGMKSTDGMVDESCNVISPVLAVSFCRAFHESGIPVRGEAGFVSITLASVGNNLVSETLVMGF